MEKAQTKVWTPTGTRQNKVASVLVCFGIQPPIAYNMITKSRGLVVPDTEVQKQWLNIFAQQLYGLSKLK